MKARTEIVAKSLLQSTAFVAFAALALTSANRAVAQTADSSRSVTDLEKENAALRGRIRRLEAESENASLHARLEQIQARRRFGQRDANPPPLQASAAPGSDRGDLILADMSVKAPPAIMPRLYSWTGFYVGGNIGYSVGSDRASGIAALPTAVDIGADTAIAPAGAVVGAQFGYNWQGGSNWLVGFEADFQGSAERSKSCVVGCNEAPIVTTDFTTEQKLDYFGTIRARLGFIYDSALFYLTGGAAYGRVTQTLEGTVILNLPGVAGGATFSSAFGQENKFGYVVGGGIEAALWGNWTGKVEYLFMDLGSTATTLAGTTPPPIPGAFTYSVVGNFRDNIVRVGANYRFGASVAPLSTYDAMAAAPPAVPIYSWTGAYVGANVGYSIGNDRVFQSGNFPVQGLTTSAAGTSVTPKGVLGGGQIGYNWQGGRNWLVGFEADLQASSQKDSACGPLVCTTLTPPQGTGSFIEFFTIQQQLDYFGTLRGRLGAISNNVLFYATGGAAFAHVRQTSDVKTNLPPTTVFATTATTADLIGWTAGGGIEAPIGAGWTGKVEYLYMDLGNIVTTTPGPGGPLTTTSTVRDNIVRVGANYHFGQEPDGTSAMRY